MRRCSGCAAANWLSGPSRPHGPSSWHRPAECQQHGREIQVDADESNATAEEEREGRNGQPPTGKAAWRMGFALALIIAGSIGLVHMTTQLTTGWLPRALLGPLVLAG